ncbi:hypothetical protein IQ219_06745 [Synechocystis sp. LEGE 06083]|uniref:hypothetical protein n=1 Tax=Synechocystis sp. LEGE 06083 TaxID=915336 RepID=UPI0018829CE3|nr:hypothetical protein [Synechocystis sp. LEGE 06083]MBE9195013.1 hypothetical protein [Synechocystis sp. LEGE 06083]
MYKKPISTELGITEGQAGGWTKPQMVVILTAGAKTFNNLGAKSGQGKGKKPYNRNKKYNLPYFTKGGQAMSRF